MIFDLKSVGETQFISPLGGKVPFNSEVNMAIEKQLSDQN